MENAKKNLVFHFGVGRHASFPQKPVVKWAAMADFCLARLLQWWPHHWRTAAATTAFYFTKSRKDLILGSLTSEVAQIMHIQFHGLFFKVDIVEVHWHSCYEKCVLCDV